MGPHELIQGGEHWLPFARSRLKALRATNLAFSSQKFLMPDGAEVRVEVKGRIEYITITGGTVLLAMDAGLIDLKGTGEGSPLRYTRGDRLDTSSTQAYNAGYAATASGTWRDYLTSAGANQLVGRITMPPPAGHLRPDGEAESFNPRRLAADPPNDPWVDSPSDATLLAKKRMAASCPASMFTGRARLYVQAMYGMPLYGYTSSSAVEPPENWPAGPTLATDAPPSLAVPAYRRQDDETAPLPVTIDSSSGVRFDAASGKHWLINVNNRTLTVYPLLSNRAGEKARKYLRGEPTAPGAAPLSAEDVERLEAFVLCYCRPDTRNAFEVDTGQTCGRLAMGYGWHWNWSATACDIVLSTTFAQDPVNFGGQFQARNAMESTHWRITLSVSGDAWTAAKSVVEGPTRWAVHRAYWCITEPVWSTGGPLTTKTTPRDSTLFACDAPFYVFYLRDELNLCRASVQEVPASVNAREMSTGFSSSTAYGGVVDEITCGDLDGYLIDRASRSSFFQATFSCGSVVYSELDMPWTGSGHRIDIVKTGYDPGVLRFDNTFFGTQTFSSGYPVPYGSGYVSTTYTPGSYSYPSASSPPTGIGNHLKETDFHPTVHFTRRERDTQEGGLSTATLIVPFFDAEALFMEGTRYLTSIESAISVKTYSSTNYGSQETHWFVVEQLADASLVFDHDQSFIAWVAASGGTLLTSTTPANETVETDTVVGKKLICRAGVIAATMDDLGSYHANDEETVSAGYSSMTGVRASSGVAIATDHIDPQGLADPETVPTSRALVGWV